MQTIELLAPARNADTAIEAIMHGADAVYMGASSLGARKSAANSLDDIKRVVDFAHIYRAKVYVTLNTIIHQHELDKARQLAEELWRAGADALIVQDMAMLCLDLPPIPLHASTQCDTRTPEKARFLEQAGFSQIVLARELTLTEIAEICNSVSVPVECFIHGALCVSYSGRCHASYAVSGRSANRGECAQICRLPYTLTDSSGRVLCRDRHLLSLKDFNATERLHDMMRAGVSSFKIEGRLKDVNYVKNITAWYRASIDKIIAENPGKYRRSSCGDTELSFEPDPHRSFNRGFTRYFLDDRRQREIASMLTPKSMGEIVSIADINNGDGISYFDASGNYCGATVNKVSEGKIITARPTCIPDGAVIHRTNDIKFEKLLAKPSAKRFIPLDISIDESGITGCDARGVKVRLPLDCDKFEAMQPMNTAGILGKLGNTCYRMRNLENRLDPKTFIPASQLTELRRRLTAALDNANIATLPLELRRSENQEAIYPDKRLDYRDNVANSVASRFYRRHGVTYIEPALETHSHKDITSGTAVMTTRHCILRELGMCLRENSNASDNPGHRKKTAKIKLPLTLTAENCRFRLKFDCNRCEMQLLTI